MTLPIPLSSEVFVATDAEGRDIITTEAVATAITLDYAAGTISAQCSVSGRSDVVFSRILTEDGILDDTSESTLTAAIALDIEANFPAEKPSEAPEAPPDEEPAE